MHEAAEIWSRLGKLRKSRTSRFVARLTTRWLFGCLLVASAADPGMAAQGPVPEPQYEGTFSYWDASSRAYTGLPRETPEAKAKARALGFGGAKTYMRWPSPSCSRRFRAAALPKFVVRVASVQKDPHDFVQFFRVVSTGTERRLMIATAGTLGFSSRTALQDGAVDFDTAVVGRSSIAIKPQKALTPGEYIFSTLDSQNSYCFGVD